MTAPYVVAGKPRPAGTDLLEAVRSRNPFLSITCRVPEIQEQGSPAPGALVDGLHRAGGALPWELPKLGSGSDLRAGKCLAKAPWRGRCLHQV